MATHERGQARNLDHRDVWLEENKVKSMLAKVKAMLVAVAENSAAITEIWNRCHGHLRPLAQHLPRVPEDRECCPVCGAEQAVRVRARLRFGPDFWKDDASVLYCHQCENYSLPPREKEGYANEAALGHPAFSDDYAELTAVDARLWSRTPSVLNLGPTTRCNFNCWYCIGRHMQQDDLSFEAFARALDNFPALRVLALVNIG
jgi:hypothetical protein